MSARSHRGQSFDANAAPSDMPAATNHERDPFTDARMYSDLSEGMAASGRRDLGSGRARSMTDREECSKPRRGRLHSKLERRLTVMAQRRRIAAEIGELLIGVRAASLPSPNRCDCSGAQSTPVRGAGTVSESGVFQNNRSEGPLFASRKVWRRLVQANGDGFGHPSL